MALITVDWATQTKVFSPQQEAAAEADLSSWNEKGEEERQAQ